MFLDQPGDLADQRSIENAIAKRLEAADPVRACPQCRDDDSNPANAIVLDQLGGSGNGEGRVIDRGTHPQLLVTGMHPALG